MQGSLGHDEDHLLPIQNGRVEGGKLTFQMTGPNDAVFGFELTLDGNSLKGTGTRTLDGRTLKGTVELKRIS